MEKVGEKFQSLEEMNESDIPEALSLSPEERLHNLTSLKKQFLAREGLTLDDLDGHLRSSDVKKVPLPWNDHESA